MMNKNYDMDNKGPARRAIQTAAVLTVRGLIVVALGSVVLMTRLLPGFNFGKAQ
jgi:hypothetical protein